MSLTAVAALIALLVTPPAEPEIRTADDLIERHIEAIGGIEAWTALRGLTYVGTYEEGGRSEIHRFDRRRPNWIRVTTKYDEATGEYGYAEGFDGAAWEYSFKVPERVRGMPATALRRAAQFDPDFLNYQSKGNRVKLLGRTTFLERDVYQLQVTSADGKAGEVFFDARTFMKVMSRGVAPMHGEGKAITILSVNSDFRPVAGVLLPHRHAQIELPSGKQLSSSTWRIEANRDVPDEWFSPPLSRAEEGFEAFRQAVLAGQEQRWESLHAAYVEMFRSELEQRRETRLNTLGYEILSHERYDDAIRLFLLALAQFPESANLHDSLGEAYLLAGQRTLSRQSYTRSLDLDPGNAHAERMIEELSRPAAD